MKPRRLCRVGRRDYLAVVFEEYDYGSLDDREVFTAIESGATAVQRR